MAFTHYNQLSIVDLIKLAKDFYLAVVETIIIAALLNIHVSIYNL